MIAVNVQWHSLPGAENVVLPLDSIRAVYESAGISLRIDQGVPLARPIGDIFQKETATSVLRALASQAPESTVHLLIGGRRSAYGALVSGELLDTDSRRLAIVYAESEYVSNRPEGLAQTCIHELGHALDLTHDSVVDTAQDYYFHSAMEQSGDRVLGAVAQSWNSCAIESATIAAALGEDPLAFGPPAPQSGCLPFAWLARREIQDLSDAGELLPGTGHHFSGIDADDRIRAREGLAVSPEHGRYTQGGILSLNIRVQIPRKWRHRIAALIGPQYGNLAIKIRQPDGHTYLHRPRTLCCVDSFGAPAKCDRLQVAFCTLRGPQGAVFDQEGTYRVCAIAPDLGARSKWVEIDVEPRRKSSALANKAVRRALAAGGALTSRTRATLRSALEDEKSLEPQTRAYLALVLSRGQCSQEEKQHFLRIAGHRNAPREIRLASLRARIERKLREKGRSGRGAIVGMVERTVPESADDGTLNQIMGDVDYALQTT